MSDSCTQLPRGKVYIASMNMRGEWANSLDPQSIKINATSAQGKSSRYRRDFSPMTPIEGGYKGYWNFESYWQSGKVYMDVPEAKTKAWWRNCKEPKRRFPKSKGWKVSHASWEGIEPARMDYLTSRKRVYVPEYHALIANRESTKYLQSLLDRGQSITVYDFDGPRKDNGEVDCQELTMSLLQSKINDVRFPFGHGYVVAATVANILPEEYVR